jgi:class 3 adenylate cyclase
MTIIMWRMPELPSGTLTLLFTDVAGSTQLVKRLQERYGAALARHHELLRTAFAEYAGTEIDTQGDSFFVVFRRARDAVEAAVAAQRALVGEPWPDEAHVSARMGLHTGEPYLGEQGYSGVAVHRAARICTIAHGGQVLLSRSTAGIVDDEEIPGVAVRDLGEHGLKDMDRPERIFQLLIERLPNDFPPLRSVERQPPLTGTVTIVMTEGRRMMRLAAELSPEHFGVLLGGYQRLLRQVLEDRGGREVEVGGDTATAAFPTAREAVLAAVAAQRAVAEQEWPGAIRPAISVGLHSGPAGVGWVGPAVVRGTDLCDAADGGQIFLSPATAGLLEDEDLGGLTIRDLGEQTTRRLGRSLRAYELVVPRA